MPELPEVETVRRGLSQWLVGSTISQADALHSRVTNPSSILPLARARGSKVVAVNRRGKFLWLDLVDSDGPKFLIAHLGMSGQFRVEEKIAPTHPHLRARFRLKNPINREFSLRFLDQRTFGWLALEPSFDKIPSLVRHIALDSFDPDFEIEPVVRNIRAKRTQIKRAILDQSILSGIGNIYADEALWRAKIHPESRCESLSARKVRELLRSAHQIMELALDQGGTSFDSLYTNVNGESGYFERFLAVYGQEGQPCPRCARPISRIAFANRSSHFCTWCQKLPI